MDLPLDGVRLLEVGGGVPAAFAGRWPASAGWRSAPSSSASSPSSGRPPPCSACSTTPSSTRSASANLLRAEHDEELTAKLYALFAGRTKAEVLEPPGGGRARRAGARQRGHPRRQANPHLRSHAPYFGEHNREVLGGALGLSDDELAALEARGGGPSGSRGWDQSGFR